MKKTILIGILVIATTTGKAQWAVIDAGTNAQLGVLNGNISALNASLSTISANTSLSSTSESSQQAYMEALPP